MNAGDKIQSSAVRSQKSELRIQKKEIELRTI
jgi:hypothetical protein